MAKKANNEAAARQMKLAEQGVERVRSLEAEVNKLLEDRAITMQPLVKAQQDVLDATQRQIDRQADLTKAFDKYKDKWRDFKEIISDPKLATGMFLVASAASAKDIAGSLMDAQKNMGLSYTQGLAMSGTLAKSVGSGFMLGIGFKKASEAATALAEEMGDISSVSSTAIVTVAQLGKKYGMAGSEAAKLFKSIKQMSGGTDEMVKSQIAHAENLARANNVAPGKVLKEMAGNTEFMAKFMGKNSMSMAETAVQASKLGVSMSSIAGMMDSILDIETSIEKEMQVSVLLGRQISFDKARQLAMAGDTLGATKEILQQVGGIAEFEAMSVIQRKALADAAGVDLATMQSMVSNREKQVEMGLVEATTQEEIFGYIMGGLAMAKENGPLVASALNMAASMSQIKFGERIAQAAHWVKEKAHALAMRILGKGKSSGGSTGTDTPTSEAPGGGMMKGLSKIKVSKVLAGAAAMLIVAAAVFVFAKAIQEFMSVSWSAVGMAVVSMLALVGAVALLGAIMMSGVGALAIIAGAAAMLIVAGAMLVLAIALKIVSEAIPNFLLLIPMLPELSIGLLTLAPAIPIMPLIGYGLILLGSGFGIAAVGVGLFGLVGGSAIITGLAAGMTVLTPLAAGIASLGPAFGSMAMGIAALAASLVLLTPMLPTLLLLGGVAMGVGAIMGGLGGDGGKDDNSNVIAEKLDILIDLMSQPGVVNMDGKKVGDVIALARGPMGT